MGQNFILALRGIKDFGGKWVFRGRFPYFHVKLHQSNIQRILYSHSDRVFTEMASLGSDDNRTASVQKVLKECFWGDYRISEEDILERLESGDLGFARFLFSKIIENSRHPSRHLQVLFPPDVLRDLLERYLKSSGGRKRIRLVAANITGNYDLVPEYRWKR